jgi:hypothetical protein
VRDDKLAALSVKENYAKLTATEMANLWASYQNDSMSLCILKYFLAKCVDTEIRPIVEFALQLSEQHLQSSTEIFNAEKFPIPASFKDADVSPDVPSLYSDPFYLYYIKNMARVGLTLFGLALSGSTRADVCSFYEECVKQSTVLYIRVRDILVAKGLFIRPPQIEPPEKVEFMTKKSIYGDLFGEQRPLTALEIAHLFANVETNTTGRTLLLGFSQVAKSRKVRKIMERGKEMAGKHIELFRGLLTKDDLPSPVPWAESVTESTIAPFSDRLMMFQLVFLTGAGAGNYGLSFAASPRKDVAATYIRLMADAASFTKDATDLMIENAWLEEPPQAKDRKALTRA